MHPVDDDHRDHPTALAFGDWLADYLESYGAASAQGVFTIDGAGPVCSWCGNIWPLCGHHHLTSQEATDKDGPVTFATEECVTWRYATT